MKKILPLLFLLVLNLCAAQEKPQVQFVSKTNVVGTCNNGSIVSASYRVKKNPSSTDTITVVQVDTTLVKIDNKFNIKFKAPLDVKKLVSVWVKEKDKDSKESLHFVEDETTIVERLTINATKNESSYADDLAAINEFKAEKEALKNTTLTYKSQIISTNFTIPLVRFNFIENDATKQGDILLFTSIGAGIGYYWGRLERTRDNTGEIISEEFSNSFGVSVGALFSAGTGDDTKNVFAPIINFSMLDFQIGIGTELGTKADNQKREFITLSYSIPLYKLFRKSYRLVKVTPAPYLLTRKAQE
jgi:hypothetical protein